jgi:hypothetical protein
MPTIARIARKAADRDRLASGLIIAAGCTVRTLALSRVIVPPYDPLRILLNVPFWTSELLGISEVAVNTKFRE